MKTGDKVRIVKICAPFIGMESLGKVSHITVNEKGIIYLDDIGQNASKYWLELVSDDEVDMVLEKSVYESKLVYEKKIKKT